MRNQFLSALQELIRTSLIAAIPIVIDGLIAGAIDWRLVGVAAAIAALRAVDKFLHELEIVTPLNVAPLDALKD